MTLAAGTRLGAYEITAPIGAGGMGEVYRARDTRLGRDVAVKVLPEAVARDADALARFEREARSVAALSHPGILAIHDFGRQDGTAYAVLELLEGSTLREKLAEGPLPPRKALELAGQIARALAAAHEKEIVHRDLKPENLFVSSDGRAKVLDFGLARNLASPPGSETNSPTAAPGTEPGAVLGTVGYMSPEQVRGRTADARSDIFSFGCVLYEMLTGRRAFQRETAAETMTAILREDPAEFPAAGPVLSPGLERIVRHCLEKEPSDRFRSAHDLAFALEAVSGASSTRSGEAATGADAPRSRRFGAGAVLAVVLLAAFVAVGVDRLLLRRSEPAMTAVRPLSYSGRDAEPAVSPDRKTLAFSSDRDGRLRIWLRQLATGDEVALTSGPDTTPRFSPDGSQILFLRHGDTGKRNDLCRVAVVGGEPRKIASDASGAADWSPDGRTIAFARITNEKGVATSRIFTLPPEGGEPKEVARFDNRAVFAPRFSPDGSRVACASLASIGNTGGGRFEVVDLGGGAPRSLETPPSLGATSNGVFSTDGRSLFYLQGLSVRLGGSRLVRQEIRSGTWRELVWVPFLTASVDNFDDGQLVADTTTARVNLYELPLGAEGALRRWLTRGISADRQPVFSPDGEWVAFTSNRGGNMDIWSVSRKTGALRHLTEDPADDWDPGFTRDGRILFSSGRSGHFEIWTADADGSSPRRVSDDGKDAENGTSTPDGWVVYWSGHGEKGGLWKVRSDGSQPTLLHAEVPSALPDVSPDGRFAAFIRNMNGLSVTIAVVRVADGTLLPFEIPVTGSRLTTVNQGRCRWAPDGKKIYFIAQDEKGVNGIYVQDFDPDRKDTSATRRKAAAFDPDVETESFAISPDGKSLVVAGLDQLYGLVTIEGVPGAGRRR